MEKPAPVIEKTTSTCIALIGSFNWFSQHASLLHTTHSNYSCSSAQIVEEKTAALNQPLFDRREARGSTAVLRSWHRRKQHLILGFMAECVTEMDHRAIPQCWCISSRHIVCLKRIPFSFTNKQGKPHCRGRENGTNRSGGNVHHLNYCTAIISDIKKKCVCPSSHYVLHCLYP